MEPFEAPDEEPTRHTGAAFKAVLAQLKRHPRELYWRFRLLEVLDRSRPPTPALRKLILESVRRMTVADPEWFTSVGTPAVALQRWSVAEIESVLAVFRCRPRSLERWTRARFWSATASRSDDERACLLAARRELDAIPKRERRGAHAVLLGDVLLRLDVAEFARVVEALTANLNLASPVVDGRLLSWMQRVDKEGHELAYASLARTFLGLPTHLRSPRARVVFNNLEGLRALRRGDLDQTARCLDEMIALGSLAEFLGNADTMSLPRALAEHGLLLPAVEKYVAAVLQRDWRAWVRPGLEELRRQVTPRKGR